MSSNGAGQSSSRESEGGPCLSTQTLQSPGLLPMPHPSDQVACQPPVGAPTFEGSLMSPEALAPEPPTQIMAAHAVAQSPAAQLIPCAPPLAPPTLAVKFGTWMSQHSTLVHLYVLYCELFRAAFVGIVAELDSFLLSTDLHYIVMTVFMGSPEHGSNNKPYIS